MPSSRLAPFLSRDFTLLYLINICEFFASTLSRLCALQWLYEATGDVVALGLVGVVTLMCQLPSIALGGVLADVLPRAPLVANVQSVAALVAVLRWLLCAAGALSPAIIYLTIGMLECTKYLEGSARDVILPQVVSSDSLPHAVSIVMITKYAAEIAAPFVFWALADAGGALTLAFFTAAVGFAACAVLPRLIRADTTPKSDEQSADGGLKRAGRDAAESVGMLSPSSDGTGPAGALSGAARTTSVAAASLTSRREHSLLGSSRREHPLLGSLLWLSRAWRSALVKMVEGVRYILSHPLLPGLYALDWGFTCVSYYRESSPCGSVSGLHACAHHGARRYAPPSQVSSSPCGSVSGSRTVYRWASRAAVWSLCSSWPTSLAAWRALSARSPSTRIHIRVAWCSMRPPATAWHAFCLGARRGCSVARSLSFSWVRLTRWAPRCANRWCCSPHRTTYAAVPSQGTSLPPTWPIRSGRFTWPSWSHRLALITSDGL